MTFNERKDLRHEWGKKNNFAFKAFKNTREIFHSSLLLKKKTAATTGDLSYSFVPSGGAETCCICYCLPRVGAAKGHRNTQQITTRWPNQKCNITEAPLRVCIFKSKYKFDDIYLSGNVLNDTVSSYTSFSYGQLREKGRGISWVCVKWNICTGITSANTVLQMEQSSTNSS